MKKMVLGIAAYLLLLSSCSLNEESTSNSVDDFDSNVINLMSATGRASINNLTAMQNDATGFKVYAKSALNSSGWYANVDGSTNYKYDSGTWRWDGTAAKWPTTTSAYPMSFYAYYPASHASFGTPVVTPGGQIKIPIDVDGTVDLLAAKVTNVTSKPSDGYLPLTFKHLLSKIDIGIIAGNGRQVYVQSISVKYLKNHSDYDFFTDTWISTIYGRASYDYWNSSSSPKAVFTPTTADEVTANPIYSGDHNKHLMLMPQTSPAWDKSKQSLTNGQAGAYIEVVYRVSYTGNPNSIGFANATDHPNYTTIGSTVTGPLFVKAGFPLATGNFTWDPSKGYIYNIELGTAGSSGGYYTNDKYIDKDGNNTNLPITPFAEPGDPVSGGKINFRLDVSNWGNQPATSIQ